MKAFILLSLLAINLSGCAVVAVGAAAVSITTTAVGVAYDVGKAGVKGVVAVGGAAADALSSPPTAVPEVVPNTPPIINTPTPQAVEVRVLKQE
ncbi:hypothetical protein [Iodobacter sp.]|uniref:hypothetical protein n=1 Tax=Iodobacter sp. TaxID=1915058 RepID=UPI0025FA41B4|nr:hypothetical protein [Iodobacter sp.]